MRAIINGVRYDTDKATCICGGESVEGVTDFRHWSAQLYRTPRSGRYFLAGEGGPMSRFAVARGDGVGGSERIIPLSEEEAMAFAEAEADAETVEEHFSHMIEDA